MQGSDRDDATMMATATRPLLRFNLRLVLANYRVRGRVHVVGRGLLRLGALTSPWCQQERFRGRLMESGWQRRRRRGACVLQERCCLCITDPDLRSARFCADCSDDTLGLWPCFGRRSRQARGSVSRLVNVTVTGSRDQGNSSTLLSE